MWPTHDGSTDSIRRPRNPIGVGLVNCPGGGFRDVWLDREGDDLALWLNAHNVTSLVLKIGTYGFSAGGPLALKCALHSGPQAVG